MAYAYKFGDFEKRGVVGVNCEGVYVISMGRRVYYVGQSNHVRTRLRLHVSGRTSPRMQSAIARSKGAYKQWDVTIYTVSDVESIVKRRELNLWSAEGWIILRLKPRFNVAHCHFFSWLGEPATYRLEDLAHWRLKSYLSASKEDREKLKEQLKALLESIKSNPDNPWFKGKTYR